MSQYYAADIGTCPIALCGDNEQTKFTVATLAVERLAIVSELAPLLEVLL